MSSKEQTINGMKVDFDPNKVITVVANSGGTGESHEFSYTHAKVIGNGSFGVVFAARIVGTNEMIAIKKVLQDRRFKNRELQIMRLVSHPNIVTLKEFFYANEEKTEDVYLNLVLEFIPETIYRASRHYAKQKANMPLLQIKLYMYQLFRSLAYIHSLGICHRDIKPQNLLLDPASGILKLCDFGSAKILVAGEPNVSYICSRYYRAPELIFGATNYTTSIDIWSSGCVMAELMLGRPLFPGESGVDQLVEIIKVLGTPTREHIQAMNQNYTEFKFPQIKANPWSKVFQNKSQSPEALDFINVVLQYTPTERCSPIEALVHPFFDELRDPATMLNSERSLPPLFHFKTQELELCPHLNEKLVPNHAKSTLRSAGIDLDAFLTAAHISKTTEGDGDGKTTIDTAAEGDKGGGTSGKITFKRHHPDVMVTVEVTLPSTATTAPLKKENGSGGGAETELGAAEAAAAEPTASSTTAV